jgi:hypothetical protein
VEPPAGPAEGERQADSTPARSVDLFLGEPTRDLADWRWLWEGNRRFPIQGRPGLLGRWLVRAEKIVRPFLVGVLGDIWERQKVFNLITIEYLQRGEDVRRAVLETHAARLDHLEGCWREGLSDVMAHNDALFSRVDQKLDRVRRDTRERLERVQHETREIWSKLASALAVAEQGGAPALAEVRSEHAYLELEQRFRGTETEITQRAAPYLERLRGRGDVLDLGCGRGEALALFGQAGISARGVDGSAAMVEECRKKGLAVEKIDLFEALAASAPESLGGVVSFHVVEHLPKRDEFVRLGLPLRLESLVHEMHRGAESGQVVTDRP